MSSGYHSANRGIPIDLVNSVKFVCSAPRASGKSPWRPAVVAGGCRGTGGKKGAITAVASACTCVGTHTGIGRSEYYNDDVDIAHS